MEEPLPKPPLRPERDKSFLRKYAQALKLEALIDLDPSSLDNESINAKHFVQIVAEVLPTPEKLRKFVTFLLTRCYLVAISTARGFRLPRLLSNK